MHAGSEPALGDWSAALRAVGGAVQGIADYEFVRPLGEGSHGRFYLAVPPARLGLDVGHVAVKVLAGTTDEEAFRRASRELRAFGAATSPYLVTLYDAGQQAGTFFYSMEYFHLGSLAAPAQPLGRVLVLRAVAQAARAAHALHEAGVVHRSIKPENVLLHAQGARLSDLGLAQALSAGQTVTGLGPIGAIEYLEPALLLGRPGTRASDIWSLGVTLHRALTGAGVYGELATGDALFAVRTVLSSRPLLSPALTADDAALVARLLAPEAQDRPRDALEVAVLLEGLAADAAPLSPTGGPVPAGV
ncbi:MAG: tyrosine protein kinase [Frankiales bacterium]|nr:tyrosine protein kinase [Frankiales bacterium]